jgi:hypothetical protein
MNHADATALIACDRCGSFTCEACSSASKRFCKPCLALYVKSPPSRRANTALLLATIGFIGFFPGVIGLVLATQELKAIERFEAPLAGEGPASLARGLGFFHVGMLLLLVAGAVYRLTQ